MARIETAFSLELNEIVDAIQANELWIDGILKDKRAFVCSDENCNAGITCKNMDTFADDRKVNPHFIMSKLENMHSDDCEVYQEYILKSTKKGKMLSPEDLLKEHPEKKVCFHVERPEKHREIDKEAKKDKTKDKVIHAAAGESAKAKKGGANHDSNYYWLNSLIWYYVDSYKNGRTKQDKIEIDFGNDKKYDYQLNSLFKRIKNEKEKTEKDRNNYVYFGMGRVFERKDGGYSIVFSEKFGGSTKKVTCVIKKEALDACQYGKANKLSILKSAMDKERMIYVLSSKVINKQYETVFLNVKNMDCIAISEVEIEGTATE